jgi:hypothetical protein
MISWEVIEETGNEVAETAGETPREAAAAETGGSE